MTNISASRLCLISRKLFDKRTVLPLILVPSDTKADLKINACECVLYVMDQ